MNLRGLAPNVNASYRQLDHWRRKGWLGAECQNPGSGTGHGDLTPACLKRALLLAAFVDAGVRVEAVGPMLADLTDDELNNIPRDGRIDLKGGKSIDFAIDLRLVPGWTKFIDGELSDAA